MRNGPCLARRARERTVETTVNVGKKHMISMVLQSVYRIRPHHDVRMKAIMIQW